MPKLGKEPKELKSAIIHEDGPYGSRPRWCNEISAKSAANADRAQ